MKRSPEAVAAHDKDAWMAIFHPYYMVEDPVGSAPHLGGVYDRVDAERGQGALSRFYDTFIAPNEIRFEVQRDLVCGNHVVRDLTIHIGMSAKVKASVPMHLLYELTTESGEWRIRRLAAHWELLPMVVRLLKKGPSCFSVLAALTIRMLRYQGLKGTWGFARAAFNIGNSGKRRLEALLDAVNLRDIATIKTLVAGESTRFYLPYGQAALTPEQFLGALSGNITTSKVLAAGDAITATCTLQHGAVLQQGVIIAEFNRRSGKICQLRCYLNGGELPSIEERQDCTHLAD